IAQSGLLRGLPTRSQPTSIRLGNAPRDGMKSAMIRLACAALLCVCTIVPAAANDSRDENPTRVQVNREPVIGQTAIQVYCYKVVQAYPHDTNAYTEGLVMQDGYIFEGTGLYTKSRLRQYELATGRIVHEVHLDERYFGEGVTVLNGTIYQL